MHARSLLAVFWQRAGVEPLVHHSVKETLTWPWRMHHWEDQLRAYDLWVSHAPPVSLAQYGIPVIPPGTNDVTRTEVKGEAPRLIDPRRVGRPGSVRMHA